MKTFSALALLATSAHGYTYWQQTFSTADCTGTPTVSMPTAKATSGTCAAMFGGTSIKYAGTCTASTSMRYLSADCTGTGTAGAAVDLSAGVAAGTMGKCVGTTGASTMITTDCSAGAMASPGAWSMVVAAASMIAVMKQ